MRAWTRYTCKAFTVSAVFAAGAVIAGPLGLSQKPGLWQLQTAMAQMPHGMVTKMCVDAGMSDRLVDTSQNMKGVTCARRDVKMRPGGATIDSVCTMAGRTVSSHAEIDMPTPNAFHETIQASFTPAVAGHTAQTTTVDAQWQGACPADMRAGDMIMPGGMKVNMYDMAAQMKARAHP